MTRTAETDYFTQYDAIALEVCGDVTPNTEANMLHSNAELCEEICELLDIDYFDLFEDLDPQALMKSDSLDAVRAHAFMYFLRWQIFSIAAAEGIGQELFNESAIAHSELWYIRLTDRYVFLTGGKPETKWLN